LLRDGRITNDNKPAGGNNSSLTGPDGAGLILGIDGSSFSEQLGAAKNPSYPQIHGQPDKDLLGNG